MGTATGTVGTPDAAHDSKQSGAWREQDLLHGESREAAGTSQVPAYGGWVHTHRMGAGGGAGRL